ncbi:phenylacetate-CoA ligase [Tamaricihabitans halophyticus]|uniref:Phenylacetate-coenzyme A ligase n=1 Tax=Tamaricihabitans halophyticus TaxID=1262583 RepID=A0A4R2QMB6_9PSEU|nr:phenylacetate--CoA ligase PaaK [Tamaricihabitans halophyticus]TCP50019.1 phenylacetate-CoA ligase [Tamaricihabitans halophyticus]
MSARHNGVPAATRGLGPAPRHEELSPAERMSVDELRAVQLERLQWTVRYAYQNVPAYRRRFEQAGVHPDELRELADLAKFPYTTKQDLRDNYPFGMLAVPMREVRRIHASSGTTGNATVTGYTAEDIDSWATVMARSIFAAGGRPGHKVHICYGYGLFTGGLGAHYGAEKLGCATIPVSGGMTARQVRLITDFQPEVIMGTPTYLLTLLDEFDRQGIDATESSLRIGILGAEPWTEQLRAELESRMNLHAVNIYGLSEVMGPGVAQECVETKDGLHIWEDHFYPEVIDPLEQTPLPDGSTGELVLTTLTKRGQPVIRYRTRDLTTLRPGTARPGYRRMDRLTGRSDDMIILRGVNVFPIHFEEIVLGTEGLSPHFQLRLFERDRVDQLEVLIEAMEPETPAGTTSAAAEIAGKVKDTLGVTVGVRIVAPDTLERSVGKLRRVIDERSH